VRAQVAHESLGELEVRERFQWATQSELRIAEVVARNGEDARPGMRRQHLARLEQQLYRALVLARRVQLAREIRERVTDGSRPAQVASAVQRALRRGCRRPRGPRGSSGRRRDPLGTEGMVDEALLDGFARGRIERGGAGRNSPALEGGDSFDIPEVGGEGGRHRCLGADRLNSAAMRTGSPMESR
jgi:hypothetical protein